MIRQLKKALYFPIARYFLFFAGILLARWKPRIIVITGTSGKTTALHFLSAQLKKKARYSHHANSAYGIAFDILGIHRKTLTLSEWPYLFLAAPLQVFKNPPQERIYIVEADCDRPREGELVACFLIPEITAWVSCSIAHSMNFDSLVAGGKFTNVDEAIAHEFGYFLQYTTGSVIVNGDSELIKSQLNRTSAQVSLVTRKEHLDSYKVTSDASEFTIGGKHVHIPALLPEENFYALAMTKEILAALSVDKIDYSYADFQLPPGRSSVFQGIKNTVIIDSSYNATPDSMAAILHMFEKYPAKTKWVIIGDMLELGEKEQEEHEKLADILASLRPDAVVLVGPRVSAFTYPKIVAMVADPKSIVTFTQPMEALEYLKSSLQGGEVLLFKGARFLEGVIEHLLLSSSDRKKLCRREKAWEIRRKAWGV